MRISDVDTAIVYGFMPEADAFRHAIGIDVDPDDDWKWSPPGDLCPIISGSGVVWYLSETREQILDMHEPDPGPGLLALDPSMHDPDKMKRYDEQILDALRPLGFDTLPASCAWLVVSYASED